MKQLLWIVIPAVFILGFIIGESRAQKSALLSNKAPHQVAVITSDVEKSAAQWASLFGMETPKWSLTQTLDEAKTQYKGKPTSAQAKLAFIKLDNLSIEIIEPVGGPSTWQDHLKEHGESAHHLAFRVVGIDEHIRKFEQAGMPLVQRGQWTGGQGGRYAYIDSYKQLGVAIELIEAGLK